MMRSAELWLMSRSCQSATFSSATMALPRSTRAQAGQAFPRIGLRLCGMAREPFWPLVNGSSASQHLGALQMAELHGATSRAGADEGERS